jgi:hypothetical protein
LDTREWFEGRAVDEEMAKCYWKRVAAIAVVGALVLLLVWPAELMAEPVFRDKNPSGEVITLHNGKCEVKEVTNLPYAAEWEEKGKTYKGCWGLNQFGVVVLYFSDKTVVGIPAPLFEKVIGV